MRPTEQTDPWMVVPQASINTPAPRSNPTRDDQGRFLTGNSGGGRRRGSRNKLTERFLDAVADDFAEHGAQAIATVRATDPMMYLKIVGSLVPRELVLQREQSPAINFDEISDEELVEVIQKRQRQKSIENVLKSIG